MWPRWRRVRPVSGDCPPSPADDLGLTPHLIGKPWDACHLQRSEEGWERLRRTPIGCGLGGEFIDHDSRCKVESVEQELVGMDDLYLEFGESVVREVPRIECHDRARVRSHRSGENMAVLRITSHRVDQPCVAVDRGIGKRAAHLAESSVHCIAINAAVAEVATQLLKDVFRPQYAVQAQLGEPQKRVAQVCWVEDASVEDD